MDETQTSASNPQSGAITARLILSNGWILAVKNLWPAYHVWMPVVLFDIASRVIEKKIIDGAWHFWIWLLLTLPVNIWLSVAVGRALLGYERGSWSINADLWRSMRASLILAAMIFVPIACAVFVALSHLRLGIPLLIGVFIYFMIVLLRASLWPIGLSVGEADITYDESARRMRGSLGATFGALVAVAVVIGAPKFFVEKFTVPTEPIWFFIGLALAVLNSFASRTVLAAVFATVHLRDAPARSD